MIDPETFDAASENLEQARARIEAAREALHQALDGRDSPRSGRRWTGSTGWRPRWRGWSGSFRVIRR